MSLPYNKSNFTSKKVGSHKRSHRMIWFWNFSPSLLCSHLIKIWAGMYLLHESVPFSWNSFGEDPVLSLILVGQKWETGRIIVSSPDKRKLLSYCVLGRLGIMVLHYTFTSHNCLKFLGHLANAGLLLQLIYLRCN